MTKETNCTACGLPATLTKTVALCARCGLAVAEEALGFVFAGVRDGSDVITLPAPPEEAMGAEEAKDVALQHLVSLKRRGATTVTFQDCRELMTLVGRSRGWVYQWLDARAKAGDLIKERTPEGVAYRFAA